MGSWLCCLENTKDKLYWSNSSLKNLVLVLQNQYYKSYEIKSSI